jgi:hypothetical protein
MDVNSNPPVVSSGDSKNNTLLAIIVLVVLILILGGGYYWKAYWNKVRVTQAPAGQVIAGFPTELIGEPGAYVVKSYSVSASGISQPTVTYISSKDINANISLFHALLSKTAWQIVRDADPKLPVTSIYATKGTSALNVTFDVRNMPIKVIEAYESGK